MRLSIIIPCYNAEPYIDELMKSLMPQVTDDVEVIVVDDGSIDDSAEVVSSILADAAPVEKG